MPDFVLMAAVVAVSLVFGGVLLVVLPRPAAEPPIDPAAGPAPRPAAASATPRPVTGPECAPDLALDGRVLVPPAGAAPTRMAQFARLSDIEKAAALWQPRDPTGLLDQLADQGFEACGYHVWQDAHPAQVTVAVLRFDTTAHADAVLSHVAQELAALPPAAGGTFAWAQPGSQWVEGDLGGGFPELMGVFARDVYLALVRISPAEDESQREQLQTLARAQYDLLDR